MEVRLMPDQEAFVRQGIASGRFHSEAEAVAEALSLWEERERTRGEILDAVDAAEISLARGEGREITEQSMRDLAEQVKERGRIRLAAGPPAWLVPSLRDSVPHSPRYPGLTSWANECRHYVAAWVPSP